MEEYRHLSSDPGHIRHTGKFAHIHSVANQAVRSKSFAKLDFEAGVLTPIRLHALANRLTHARKVGPNGLSIGFLSEIVNLFLFRSVQYQNRN